MAVLDVSCSFLVHLIHWCYKFKHSTAIGANFLPVTNRTVEQEKIFNIPLFLFENTPSDTNVNIGCFHKALDARGKGIDLNKDG